jgi:hypothetical protein
MDEMMVSRQNQFCEHAGVMLSVIPSIFKLLSLGQEYKFKVELEQL